jgi:hypothetical protein
LAAAGALASANSTRSSPTKVVLSGLPAKVNLVLLEKSAPRTTPSTPLPLAAGQNARPRTIGVLTVTTGFLLANSRPCETAIKGWSVGASAGITSTTLPALAAWAGLKVTCPKRQVVTASRCLPLTLSSPGAPTSFGTTVNSGVGNTVKSAARLPTLPRAVALRAPLLLPLATVSLAWVSACSLVFSALLPSLNLTLPARCSPLTVTLSPSKAAGGSAPVRTGARNTS